MCTKILSFINVFGIEQNVRNVALILMWLKHKVEKHDDIDLDEWLSGLYVMLKGSRFPF